MTNIWRSKPQQRNACEFMTLGTKDNQSVEETALPCFNLELEVGTPYI